MQACGCCHAAQCKEPFSPYLWALAVLAAGCANMQLHLAPVLLVDLALLALALAGYAHFVACIITQVRAAGMTAEAKGWRRVCVRCGHVGAERGGPGEERRGVSAQAAAVRSTATAAPACGALRRNRCKGCKGCCIARAQVCGALGISCLTIKRPDKAAENKH